MKEYVRLSVDVMAYYSGNTYYEEVFLPKEVWDEIKDEMPMHIYISELDGKHSEVKAEIDVEEFNENELVTYLPDQENDGEDLFYHIYEYLDENKYNDEYLLNVQEEIENLRQVETLTIKIKTQDKDQVMKLLKDYLI